MPKPIGSTNVTSSTVQRPKYQSDLTFPVSLNAQSVKFDDLCVNFQEHEALDADSPIVTATKDVASGTIVGMSLDSTGGAGVIPVTIPTADVGNVSLLLVPTCFPGLMFFDS